ncbi:glycoside hydrolase family 3 C-terminal domain-containing protein [Chryseobacterium sp. D764]|uniref:glycoside hydrolase family 3 N-terminal domain-containing protein n=1 Tax=unclassified Chryseobacterium TaxID=2593645 RepID=UPI0015C28EE0|nr:MULTISPECIES: glycoside hydrolase family 3 N-terminal domain-containing protein [unclassified Chryseobacterium]QXU49834.1 glycoside hydrolase family 3 C-terminal domain-containing protein [Chryseobacterium sp. D764]CAD0225916.1 Periplasmic beta-glucosidase [Chryseobacterium sp. JV274]
MKRAYFLLAFSALGMNAYGQKTIDQKVAELLSKMTLEEKVGQMVQYSGFEYATGPQKSNSAAVLEEIKKGKVGSMLNVAGSEETRSFQKLAMQSRLKIPLLFGQDVIHGYRTTFPVNLGQAASWDMGMIEKSERIAATEAAAYGIHWTFAPMVDIARDPRWGRVMEGSGEDTYLGTKIGLARIKGFQGRGLGSLDAVMACAKHFAAYGAAVGGRDYNSVDMSLRQLNETYLPPFKAAAEAGVATFMNSFNDINGIPATANKYIQRDLLKGKWNYKGFVVSDWGSIGEMVPHGYAKDANEAAEKAIQGGSDMDMESRVYMAELPKLVKEGKVDPKLIDDATGRILTKKFEMGLFDDPYRFSNEKRQKEQTDNQENRKFGREFGSKSIVLLKNQGNILPLSKTTKTVALIGPFGKETVANHGFWSIAFKDDNQRIVSQFDGIKNQLDKNSTLLYAKGCNVDDQDRTQFAEAVETAKKADVVIMTLGEGHAMSGEAKSRSNIGFTGVQEDLLKEIAKTGKPIILMINAGRPLIFNWAADHIPTIVYTWWLGTEAGNSIADVLFGTVNPGGKLPMSFPRTEGQIPVYYNHYNTGRPAKNNTDRNYVSAYIDLDNDPKYPFGYGLSYADFKYSDMVLSSASLTGNQTLNISVTVSNTGKYDGEEVVQLYIRDLFGKVVRPVKELKGFQKVLIKKGESKKVEFKLTPEDLKFFDDNLNFDWESGEFDIMIGTNSQNVQTKRINWTK